MKNLITLLANYLSCTSLKALITTFFILLTTSSYSQSTSYVNYDSLKAVVNISREGKGNNTCALTPTTLANIIKSNSTLNTIQAQLGKWSSIGADNSVSLEWNDKTKAHDIPLFDIHYNTSVGTNYCEIIAEVRNNFKGEIKELSIRTTMNGLTLAKFKQALINNGYLINENFSSIIKKQAWQKKGYPTITIVNNSGLVIIKAF